MPVPFFVFWNSQMKLVEAGKGHIWLKVEDEEGSGAIFFQ